jgi:hypothetical protein
LPSQLDDEDPRLLSRIMQMRSFVATREAMKSDKQRERDAKPKGPMAVMVARAQQMNQTRTKGGDK